jgi:L-asparaginase II
MNLVPLAQTARNSSVDCVYFGAVAVVNASGKLLASAGDAQHMTFTRSCLKALQALPFMQADGPAKMGFSEPQIALMCASHSGEAPHIAEVQNMLDAIGQSHKKLKCGCHAPLHFSFFDKAPPEGATFDERYNNCSGKHTGFLAYCVQHGLPIDTYLEPTHPLQKAIRTAVAQAAGMDEDAMPVCVDGCSAPNYAMPLTNLARAYARIASGAADTQFGTSFAQLGQAMSSFPEMVSGIGRNDAALMRAGRGDWVTKVGADGAQVVASKARGEAFALKVIDGSKPALFAATVEILDQLGWLDDAQRAQLEPLRARVITNARGLVVGERSTPLKLLHTH